MGETGLKFRPGPLTRLLDTGTGPGGPFSWALSSFNLWKMIARVLPNEICQPIFSLQFFFQNVVSISEAAHS